jgi:hypothetical protein
LLCLPIIFLFARTPPDDECQRTVHIGPHIQFVHQCDAYSMTTAGANLEYYATTYLPARLRASYIVAETFLAEAFSPVAVLVRAIVLRGHVSGAFQVGTFLSRYPYYFALTIINFAILAAGLWMAFRLAGSTRSILAPALGAAVASSDMVHGMIWGFHPSFVNLIVPLGGIFYFVHGCRASRLGIGETLALGGALAVTMLCYSYVVIWLAAFGCGWLFWLARERSERNPGSAGRGAATVLILGLVGLAPIAAWAAYSLYVMHLPVSYEATDYRQFVWVLDAVHAHDLGAAFRGKWAGFFPGVFVWLGWPGLFAACGIAILAAIGWRRVEPRRLIRDPVLAGVLVTLLGMASFNFLQGYYQPRLINGLVLALFVGVARIAYLTGQEKPGAAILVLGAVLQVALAFIAPAITMT